MADPIITLLSDDDGDDLRTPLPNHRKRHKPPTNLDVDIVVVDDPTPTPPPSKLLKSSSSTMSFVPETPFSDLIKSLDHPPVIRCSTIVPFSSILNLSGEDGIICVESDDEGRDAVKGNCLKNIEAGVSCDVGNDLEKYPACIVKEKQLENKIIVRENDIESWLDIDSDSFLHTGVVSNVHVEGEGVIGERRSIEDWGSLADSYVKQDVGKSAIIVAKENCQGYEGTTATFNLESSEKCPTILQSTCHGGNLKSKKAFDRTKMEDYVRRIQLIQDLYHEKESVRLEEGASTNELESGDEGNAKNKKTIDKQAASRKKLLEEKRQKKEQEKLQKALLKIEVARSKQLVKQTKKLEKYKFSEKDIVAVIDPKVLSGSLGGQLLTMFGQKHLVSDIVANPIEKSIIWRMKLPEAMSQVSTVKTDIPYILLIYDNAEEFCKYATDGSFMEHISLVRNHYPLYTICCLTNRLMSFVNKREQQKYKKQKEATDWKRPPLEELFAKITTQFANVNSRHCVDESELAEHVVGLTISLAKCHSRKKLTHLSVNANGGNVPKDCMDRALILKHPWLKALVSIPKVQPRYAIAIWKKYPTMKSLLRTYMDPTKSVLEKESLLVDLPLEDILGNGQKRLGEKCSKRVFRILMAQNGKLTTDDIEDGADYFPIQGQNFLLGS